MKLPRRMKKRWTPLPEGAGNIAIKKAVLALRWDRCWECHAPMLYEMTPLGTKRICDPCWARREAAIRAMVLNPPEVWFAPAGVRPGVYCVEVDVCERAANDIRAG